jgi:hypothetical protein
MNPERHKKDLKRRMVSPNRSSEVMSKSPFERRQKIRDEEDPMIDEASPRGTSRSPRHNYRQYASREATRWLNSQVGETWSEVFSKIRATYGEVAYAIESDVIKKTHYAEDGKTIMALTSNGEMKMVNCWRHFFVDPRGVLQKNTPVKYKPDPNQQQWYEDYVIFDGFIYFRVHGLYFRASTKFEHIMRGCLMTSPFGCGMMFHTTAVRDSSNFFFRKPGTRKRTQLTYFICSNHITSANTVEIRRLRENNLLPKFEAETTASYDRTRPKPFLELY